MLVKNVYSIFVKYTASALLAVFVLSSSPVFAQAIPVSESFSIGVTDATEVTASSRFEMTDGTLLPTAFLAGGSVMVHIIVEDLIAATTLYDDTIIVSGLGGAITSLVSGTPLTGELTTNLIGLNSLEMDFVFDITSLVPSDTTLKVYYRADYVGLLGRARRYVHEANADVYARAFDDSI
ncbi:hypothetical protein [Arenicella xantha]|uniref:Cohesin domain-containing protein n=1 Tax=Arenicella xantha TaxID=644221 RepID=A0A395JKE6_9GAMM|nr:hypothetical protein [Arenicella xantha]RBP51019.1 hypothetical protein DFR28_102436 [Arenicella xantha]